MSFDGLPGRVRAIERSMVVGQLAVFLIGPGTTDAEAAELEQAHRAAVAAGRDSVLYRIDLSAAPRVLQAPPGTSNADLG